MRVLGIDPSNTRHAWALIDTGNHGGHPEDLDLMRAGRDFFGDGAPSLTIAEADLIVIEMIASYGMAVGAHTFDTCVEIGRLMEWLAARGRQAKRITRVETKRIVCRSVAAKDANVRAALIDLFGGPGATKRGGALHGVAKDTWAALAVAVAASSDEAQWYTPVADKEMLE